jgi:hypothetical protein
MTDKSKTRSDKFKGLACEVEVDEDEARRDERLTRVAKHRPAQEKPE